jgi:hypothetical protein
MNEATMDSNKLIAEFMGMETDENGMYRYTTSVDDYTTDDLSYFEYSWDWLMPVVEKIERLGYSFEKNYQPIDKDWQSLIVKGYNILFQEFNVDSLKSSYKVVVEFIKSYNKKQ